MDTLAKLAVQGGAFLTAAVVLAYLSKWFVLPALKVAWGQLLARFDVLATSVSDSTTAQQETREEVVRMSARLDAFMSIDARDERRHEPDIEVIDDTKPLRIVGSNGKKEKP